MERKIPPSRDRIRSLVSAALFVAILAVVSQIAIPLPGGVPLTLQIFGVALCGACLGPLRGAGATVVFLFMGAVGLPVFSGFVGGVSALFSYTGGFLLGFPVLAAACGLAADVEKKAGGILLALLGLTVCHLLGVAQYSVVGNASLGAATLTVSVPYLAKDVFLTLFALHFARKLRSRGIV